MKKALLGLLLLSLPWTGYAKYCPTCIHTYQTQTTRGHTHLVYQWVVRALRPDSAVTLKQFSTLFDDSATLTWNGKQVADDLNSAFRYFMKSQHQQPLVEAQLTQLLVDGEKHAALSYQLVTRQHNNHSLHRSLVMVILTFKAHKVTNWQAVSYTQRIRHY